MELTLDHQIPKLEKGAAANVGAGAMMNKPDTSVADTSSGPVLRTICSVLYIYIHIHTFIHRHTYIM